MIFFANDLPIYAYNALTAVRGLRILLFLLDLQCLQFENDYKDFCFIDENEVTKIYIIQVLCSC